MTTTIAGRPQGSDSLDRLALSGAAWSGAARWTTQIVSWLSTILVARLLVPSDYGLVTMAGVFLGVVAMLSEFGIGSTVITMREITGAHLRQLNGFAVLLGIVGSSLTALAAQPLGHFFDAPELPAVVAVIGLSFMVNSFQTVPAALLRRELRFRTLAFIDLARGALAPVVTLLAALAGFRYWALVAGSLTAAIVASLLTNINQRISFSWPKLTELEHALRFGRDLLVGRIAWTVYQQGDFAVAAKQLGQTGAGLYSLAWTLATGPLEKLTVLISDVTPGLFSAVQHDRSALRRYFLNLTELLCLVSFPTSVGLALVSSDIVTVFLGPKWAGMEGPLALLALYAGARIVTQLFGFLFITVRETRFMMWMSVTLAVALLGGFIVGSRWGGIGIAAAWVVIHPAFSIYTFTRVRRALDLPGREYLRVLRLGLDGTFIMVAAVLTFQIAIAHEWAAPWRLLASIALGTAVFLLATWLLHRVRIRQIVAWVQRVRSARHEVATAST